MDRIWNKINLINNKKQNLIKMIIDILPSPLEMTSDKVEHLICHKAKHFKNLPKETQLLKQG